MFGGAVAALADPIPALACDRIFPGNLVWTLELHVDFRRPGIADLELRFTFGMDIEEQVSEELRDQGLSTPCFEFGFYLPDGELSAWITNRVAIRLAGGRLLEAGALGKSANNLLKSDKHD